MKQNQQKVPDPFDPSVKHRWVEDEDEPRNNPESFVHSDWKVTCMVTIPALIVICILGYFFVQS